jgi:hypothetical protein
VALHEPLVSKSFETKEEALSFLVDIFSKVGYT